MRKREIADALSIERERNRALNERIDRLIALSQQQAAKVKNLQATIEYLELEIAELRELLGMKDWSME